MNTFSIAPWSKRPPLDSAFLPAARWRSAYQAMVEASPKAQPLILAIEREDGACFRWETKIISQPDGSVDELTFHYVERSFKTLLWQRGGSKIFVGGSPFLRDRLEKHYAPDKPRGFDSEVIGKRAFRSWLTFEARSIETMPTERSNAQSLGGHWDGCRIGFDLGGSDRKAAAVINGDVVFSEEIPWNPYFESDPAYHLKGIEESLQKAASHLPRVDAIGGSAAGIYINNEARVGSLFRGINEKLFESKIRRLFIEIGQKWKAPLVIVNDGEVTALAGALARKKNSLLGISLGTSEATGYVDASGSITPWLNELAFVPIDYRQAAPTDEWSQDVGCGVQYLSQQAVFRLLGSAGIILPPEMPQAEQLVHLQELMNKGDARASLVYETLGTYLGHALAEYSSWISFSSTLLLGRVTSGPGGDRLIEFASETLRQDYPEIAENMDLFQPNEMDKRHGQAVAAASLPPLSDDA